MEIVMDKVVVKPEHMTESKKLRDLRGRVRKMNKSLPDGVDFRWKVQYYPKIGKFNPNAWKYANKFGRKWRLEDADYVVAYVGKVRPRATSK
jgi:hypothetical protein